MNIMTSSSMILQLVTLLAIIIASVTQINSAPHPECQTTCGDLTIPFPFGTTSECCLDISFLITCNNSYNPPKPFLNLSNAEVLDISLDGLLHVTTPIPSDFHDKISSQIDATIPEFLSSNFWLATTPNKLVAVSLGTYALVEGSEEWKHVSAGCKSFFERDHGVLNTNSRVEDFLDDISVDTYPMNKDNLNPYDFYGCALESSDFQVSSWDIRNIKAISIVFAWSIGNVTCLVSRENLVDYACRSPHSTCSDSSHGLGYNCNCLAGFQGSPYLVDGCQDIDEYIEPNPCERTCTNLNGSYSCSCPEGFGGDGKKNGSGCHQLKSQIKGYTSLYVTSGFHRLESQIRGSVLFYITFGFIISGVGSSWIFWRIKQKKLVKLRKDLFKSNGGLILEDMLERRGTLSIFTAEELKKATNNYAENNIISRDHHSVGVVYRGELLIEGVNTLVTVKRCIEVEQCQVKVFVSKLVTFSLMRHTNVVKLIGCCLETPVPLLVYEFVSVKTLYDYIHEGRSADFLLWDTLLKIVTETAGALSYMHSANSLPIIHGNFNSSNVLIHHSHTAKVQGFALEGSYYSPEVPFNLSEKREYLDPEYLSSGTLTEKSDVYSFGVVLAEILTGKYVFENAGGQHFAQHLASSSTRDVHIRIQDHRLKIDCNFEQLTQVGKLAERCLSVSSTERPSMKEVAVKLESVISTSSSAKAIKPNSRLPTKVRSLLRRNKSL